MVGIAEIRYRMSENPSFSARIRFPLYVAGRRIKVVPRYALGFHLDAPPGSGTFASRISRWKTIPKWEIDSQDTDESFFYLLQVAR